MACQAPIFKSMIFSEHTCTSSQLYVVLHREIVKAEAWIMLLQWLSLSINIKYSSVLLLLYILH